MANVTIYLPDVVEKKVRKAARTSKQPVSRWISDQIVRGLESGWPREFLDAAGSMPDFPDVQALPSGYGSEAKRDEFE